ncbi:MAG: ATP-dependent zinc protease [Phycisphaerales bacterium]|nr:ATP-dependent zinc protease [Phycisphaerales bacterium]
MKKAIPGKVAAKPPKPVIGWREWVALPSFGIAAIKAKIDTGARTSSLHAWDLRIVRRGGRDFVRFVAHPLQRSLRHEVEVTAPLVDQRQVRNSGGRAEWRPVVLTEVELHGQRFAIELTLTKRDLMGFRMLLGRTAIRRRFLVDVGRSFISQSPPPASPRPKRKLRPST